MSRLLTRNTVLHRMLRPAARLCLRLQIPVGDALEVFRSELVQEAAMELKAQNRKITTSLVSLMTGIHRREVKRMLTVEPEQPEGLPTAVKILGVWEHDPRYCEQHSDKPRALSFGDDRSEFSELARSVTKDVSPGTMLVELERMQAVARTPKGLELISTAARLFDLPFSGMALMAEDINALSDAALQNLFAAAPTRNLHLRTEYDNIVLKDIPQIRQQILRLGLEFHKQIRDLIATYDKDFDPSLSGEGGGRVVVGAFSLTDPVHSDRPTS